MEDFLTKLMEVPETIKENRDTDAAISYFSKDAFNNTLKNLRDMSEHDVFNFIKCNIDYISNMILQNEPDIIGVLTNPRFIRPFSQVIASMPITFNRRVSVNKVCYDYFTSELDDKGTKAMLLDMSRLVNNDKIQQLTALGLDANTASNLSMSRYSSMDEKVNIKRLNFVICCKGTEIMTEQMIVWIYEKLFDRIGELFNTTMLEYYVPNNSDDEEDFMEVFSTISLAILTIVNNMTSNDIYKIIKGYIQDWKYAGRPYTRTSLMSLSADFGRIQTIVDLMIAQGEFIP